MKLFFNKPYKSIQTFNEIDLPDFTVLVGKNGSGKTHILEAIKTGSLHVDLVKREEDAMYFNSYTFSILNQSVVSARSIEDLLDQSWDSALTLQKTSSGLSLEDLRIRIDRQFSNEPVKRALLINGLTKPNIPWNKVRKETFIKYAHLQDDEYKLPNTLSHIFFEYKRKMLLWGLPTSQGGKGLNEEQLRCLEDNAPWVFINKMFKSFGLLHKVKAPEFVVGDILETGKISFQANPIFEETEINFTDLSSGERILCALAITVFQDHYEAKFPKLLLLDELDATLHPSMVKNLLNVIDDVFLKNNCKVILATHCPSTVALVEEASIFEVKSFRAANRIEKISQSEAVEVLSEGFMSLEKGIALFDQVSSKQISIITEGDNITHLEHAVKLLQPDLLEKIHFLKGVEGTSGKNQLTTLFEFFKLAPHKNKVLFVLDCEVNTASRKEGNQTFIYSLPKNEANKYVSKGIENIYPESLFAGFITTEIDPQKRKTERFAYNMKSDFTKRIVESATVSDLKNYLPFIERVKELLK